jgi:hypothetical protein
MHKEIISAVCTYVFSSICPSIWFITEVTHLISINFGTEIPQYKLPEEFELGLQAYWFLEAKI